MWPARLTAVFEGLGDGQLEALTDLLAEDCELVFPGSTFGGTHRGARKVRVFLKQNQRLFQVGLHFTVHASGQDGDRVFVQWTNAGTTRTGVDYANRGVTVFTLDADRIVRIEDYLDTERLAETWPS